MAEDLTDEKYLDMATMRARAGVEVEHAFEVVKRSSRPTPPRRYIGGHSSASSHGE